MKIATVVGARPQFIKAAAVSRVLRNKHQEILIHTGQHYDNNMSDIFFKELSIPKPEYNLGAGSKSHAKQTAQMLIGIEEILLNEKPDLLLVYGDTNSTLAGALSAAKIHIPIAHVEAGLRSFNMKMPEEQNRLLTDRLSSILFCPTETAVLNLKNEGIISGVYNVGDVMCDAVLYYIKKTENNTADYYFAKMTGLFDNIKYPDKWYMTTIHRAENTDDINKINEILRALDNLNETVIFPVHPRTKSMVKQLYNDNKYNNIIFIEPVGYLDMLYLTKNAIKVITDSGGLQKEAYIMQTPCITVRDQTEWVETLEGNNNILCKPVYKDIIDKVFNTKICINDKKNYYGDGEAALKITELLN